MPYRLEPRLPLELPVASGRRIGRFALAVARARRGRLALATLAAVAASAVALAGPALLGAVVDAVVEDGGRARIDALALAYLGVAVSGGALAWLAALAAARLGEDVLCELRERTFERVTALPASVVERAGAGDVLTRLTDDVETLTEARARTVALVAQEPHVFAASVADNLRLACPGATDAQLRAVIAAVDGEGWIATLPSGLETRVGAGGETLDPAAAQRLALARVSLADPGVVLLDEATAALGAGQARAAERALAPATADRTVIAIAHDLAAAEAADRVLVMSDGRVVEQGAHAELLQRGGEYARLWTGWRAERERSLGELAPVSASDRPRHAARRE